MNESSPMVSFIATSHIFDFNRVGEGSNHLNTIFDVLYSLGRTSIAHEGRDSPLIEWTNDGSMSLNFDKDAKVFQKIPSDYLFGLALAVITAPENGSLRKIPQNGAIELRLKYINGRKFILSQLWGGEDYLYAEISAQMHGSIHRSKP